MTEAPYIPTEEQIFAAESIRTRRTSDAAEQMRPAVEYPLDAFADLPLDEQQRLLMASRIYVVANGSLAKRAWEAPTVAHYLGRQRQAIIDVYRNEQVVSRLPHITTDTQGTPYGFEIETAGDELSFSLTLATLINAAEETGNTAFLTEAVRHMNAVIAKRETASEPTAVTLATFNQQRDIYHGAPIESEFDRLTKVYSDAIKASLGLSRWERIATISSRYAVDSVRTGHPIETVKGIGTALYAGVRDRNTANILPREIRQALTENARHTNWRRTIPQDVDYSPLALPARRMG